MNAPNNTSNQYEAVQSVLQTHQDALMSKPNVVGVGIGLREAGGIRTETVCIVVLVTQKVPRARLSPGALLPTELDGIPVDVQEAGKISAQS